jgi:hypothetical protein
MAKKKEFIIDPDVIDEMASEDEPKLEKPKKKLVRPTTLVIAVLLVSLVGLGVLYLTKLSPSTRFAGVGDVSGFIENTRNTPVSAEIFVLNQNISTTSGTDGQFTLSNVPGGDQTLIVAYQGMGKEVPVTVRVGLVLSVGTIIVEETQLPPVN